MGRRLDPTRGGSTRRRVKSDPGSTRLARGLKMGRLEVARTSSILTRLARNWIIVLDFQQTYIFSSLKIVKIKAILQPNDIFYYFSLPKVFSTICKKFFLTKHIFEGNYKHFRPTRFWLEKIYNWLDWLESKIPKLLDSTRLDSQWLEWLVARGISDSTHPYLTWLLWQDKNHVSWNSCYARLPKNFDSMIKFMLCKVTYRKKFP